MPSELRVKRKPTDRTLDTVSDANPLPVSVLDANQLSSTDLMEALLVQMRIMNAHLALVTGEQITGDDLEEVT